jgi:AraC family transcriptional activator of pobA
MQKKVSSIPINRFATEYNKGISIDKISINDSGALHEADQAERHDSHSFLLLEKGTVSIEIDFKKHLIKSPSVLYMHPNQVHIVHSFKNVTVCSLAMTNENLNNEYLSLLEEITPAEPLKLKKETFAVLSEAVSLCISCVEKNHGKLYNRLLKDISNTLVGLVITEYLEHSRTVDRLSRFEIVTKAFNQILERNYMKEKRPAAYAKALNISTPYLNECVRKTTGYPVSWHIQHRIILEAKRLLYHSGKSIKEIAFGLGYDDYHYFSRLFSKVASVSPITFRNKKLD